MKGQAKRKSEGGEGAIRAICPGENVGETPGMHERLGIGA